MRPIRSRYEDGTEKDKHFPNMAIARFCAAAFHVRSGDLDAAQHSAQTALGMAPEHHDAVTDKSAKRLHRQLYAPRVHSAPLAIEIRDQIEEFLSAAPARLELS